MLSNRYPSADALEVFQGNSASSALSMFHDALADRVVHVGGEARFLLGSLLQSEFGRLGSLSLELLTKPAVAITHVVHQGRRIHLPIRVHSDVRYSQVNSNHVSDINRLRLLYLTSSKEVELAVNQSEISLSMPKAQEIILPRAADKWYLLTTPQAPDRNDPIWQSPVEDSVVIGDSPILLESASLPVIQLIAVSHLADTADNHLCCQGERGSRLSVSEFVKLKLAKCIGLPCRATDSVAGSIRRLQGLTQQLCLGFIRKQFDLGCKFHGLYHTTLHYQCLEEKGVCVSSTS
jgi:hypothetical protein